MSGDETRLTPAEATALLRALATGKQGDCAKGTCICSAKRVLHDIASLPSSGSGRGTGDGEMTMFRGASRPVPAAIVSTVGGRP